MQKKKESQSHHTNGNHVYSFLKNSILGLQVKPGQPINVKELSEHLEISRSPIRDALIQLEKDGLVMTLPQKGTFVSKIDMRRVRDERFLRACLEVGVLGEFFKLMTDDDLDRMEHYVEMQRVHTGDARKFIEFDDCFHAVIFECTNHPFCLEISHNMSGHYQRIRLLSLVENDICMQTIEEHIELVRGLRNGELESTQQLLFRHIKEKNSEERKLKNKYPSIFVDIDDGDSRNENIWENDFLVQL